MIEHHDHERRTSNTMLNLRDHDAAPWIAGRDVTERARERARPAAAGHPLSVAVDAAAAAGLLTAVVAGALAVERQAEHATVEA
jgi:hypothetical protein